jgi:hypothetical protein
VDVDEVADELYGLPPDEFMAARTAREQEARADGDRALAARIRALAKPSAAAWACNVLVRRERDEIAHLVELGGLLREAQQNLAGDQLRALDVQRRQVIGVLTRQARSLAHRLGHPVSASVGTQIEETLRAAMADPDAGEALLEGRLISSLSYTGMGLSDRPNRRVVPAPEEKPAPTRNATPKEGPKKLRKDDDRRDQARRAAEDARRREVEDARRALEEATTAAEEAAEAVQQDRQRADELGNRHKELLARAEELTAELAHTREEAARVGGERSRAEHRQQVAKRRSSGADRARDRARAALDRLTGAGER